MIQIHIKDGFAVTLEELVRKVPLSKAAKEFNMMDSFYDRFTKIHKMIDKVELAIHHDASPTALYELNKLRQLLSLDNLKNEHSVD